VVVGISLKGMSVGRNVSLSNASWRMSVGGNVSLSNVSWRECQSCDMSVRRVYQLKGMSVRGNDLVRNIYQCLLSLFTAKCTQE